MNVTRIALVLVVALAVGTVSLAARAQPAPKVVRIGVLAGGGSAFQTGFVPFRQRLQELGYVEGQNLVLEVRNAEGRTERHPALVAELVGLKVDVIVVQGNAALAALRKATQSIPIVMAMIGDPVGAGFVASLAKPGGNISGVSNMVEGISAKYVELLKEAAPPVAHVGVLRDPKNAAHARMWTEIEAASRALGIRSSVWDARQRDSITEAFTAMAAKAVEAVIILPDPAFGANLRHIAHLAATHRMPAIYPFREFPHAGGLMSYGPSITDNWRRAAEYVDKILTGMKPADLPVSQPLTFDLVINQKTMTALGLPLPPSFSLRAHEILQ